MGISLSAEEKRKPHIEVSGRKGLGVKADDLIDRLIESALGEVKSRHPAEQLEEQRGAATEIAIGALRYFLLKYTRTSVIAFDFEEALSFEGNTGPYVQYAAVRARNILRKFEERGEHIPDFQAELTDDLLTEQLQQEQLWNALVLAAKVDSVVDKAIATGEPAHVATFAFQLAQGFSGFYHDFPVLQEADRDRRLFLLWIASVFAQQIHKTLLVLGIPVPKYM
jgi:arginyl-tRNA synthetase